MDIGFGSISKCVGVWFDWGLRNKCKWDCPELMDYTYIQWKCVLISGSMIELDWRGSGLIILMSFDSDDWLGVDDVFLYAGTWIHQWLRGWIYRWLGGSE